MTVHHNAWIRESTRWAIYLRDGLRCFWCEKGYHDGVALTLDHVVARAAGGDNSWGNLVTSCFSCNRNDRREPTKNEWRRIRRLQSATPEQVRSCQIAAATVLAHGAPWITELKRRARENRFMPSPPTVTRVVNINRGESFDVYIGRAGKGMDGYFGNPVIVWKTCQVCEDVHSTRGDTIDCFERYARERAENDAEWRTRVAALHGQILGCFCAPLPCHGDTLAKLAAEWSVPPPDHDDVDLPF